MLHRKLCTKVFLMSEKQDAREWFSSTAGKRVTAVDMAEILNISRNATNSRLAKGLDADDLIAISRGLEISPIHALVELGKVTYDEVLDFLEGDGTLLQSATQEQLIYRLAEDALPASDRISLGAAAKALVDRRDDLASRRSNKNAPGVHPLSDDEIAADLYEANQMPSTAHDADDDTEYTEPELP